MKKIYSMVKSPHAHSYRCLSTDLWNKTLNLNVYKETEEYWRKEFSKTSSFNKGRLENKFYLLSMFPYPSGSLHMGHVRVYTVSDSLALFHRMNGKNVFQPMGWDAFGLPAENAAFERQLAPDEWTRRNIEEMRKQLQNLSFSFDWNYELNTCDPKYYRWTQFLFLKMYEAGFIYRKEALVNWDPIDETVLADEQVDENGCSWRSGAKVVKRVLKQWFVRTTKFAKNLYEGLNDENLKNWNYIKTVQRNWIGTCDGYSFDFEVESPTNDPFQINVWIQNPLHILKAEFIVVKPDSLLDILSRNSIGMERKLEFKAVNPFTHRSIPIYCSTSITFPFQRDVYIGIPSIYEADEEFAHRVHLELQYEFEPSDVTVDELCKKAQELGIGGYPVSSKLKDWLISRQRYWGTPIPLIHCSDCGTQPVPYEDLPVILPQIPKGHRIDRKLNKLLEQPIWKNTTCPKCGSEAFRETDTMDTFVDSSWYYLRYTDCNNELKPFESDFINRLLPVDLYVGGREHAVLHLYYARFVSHFLHSIKLIKHREPFQKLLCQGKVKSKTYKNSQGRYFRPEEIIFQDDEALCKETKEKLTYSWEKMSKSKYNGIDPNSVLNEYGVDTTRLFLLFETSPEESINWNPKTFTKVLNWQYRMWLTIKDFLRVRRNPLKGPQPIIDMVMEQNLLKNARNSFLSEITYHYNETQDPSLVAYRLQALTMILRKPAREVRKYSKEYERCLAAFIVMLAPLAPHFASTLWFGFVAAPARLCEGDEINWNKNVLQQKWPKVDSDHMVPWYCKIDDNAPFKITSIENQVVSSMTSEKAFQMAIENEIFKRKIHGKEINKIELEKYEGYEATLRLTTVKNDQVKISGSDTCEQR